MASPAAPVASPAAAASVAPPAAEPGRQCRAADGEPGARWRARLAEDEPSAGASPAA